MLKCDAKRESRPESGIPARRTAPDRASRAGIILIVFRSYRIDSPVAGFISEEESPSTRRQAYKIRRAARSSTENLFSFLPD